MSGRKKIYLTKEQKNAANRRNSKAYYERNKDKCRRKRMQRYWGERLKKQDE